MYPQYKVNGILFNTGDDAEWYARQQAIVTGKKVPVMEKLDDMTPWHICCVITGE